MLKPYKKPQLYNAGGDISQRWFVFYSYVNPATGKFERIKVYQDLNTYKTKTERNEYAALLVKSLTELLDSGYNPFQTAAEQKVGAVQSLAQAVPAFLDIKTEQLRGKTMMGYRSMLGHLLRWAESNGYHHQHMKHLTPEQIQAYFTQARKVRRISPTTHNSELATIRAFFRFWQQRHVITINPADAVRRIREEIATHAIYADWQIHWITTYLNETDTSPEIVARNRQLLHAIRFVYYACIRPNELRNLRVGDIRLNTNTVLIRADSAKSGRAEPIDISPGLAEVIADMNLTGMPESWYVFGNQATGKRGNGDRPEPGPLQAGPNYLTRYYREILDDLEFPATHTMYSWKHTRNVHLYNQTKDLLRVMRHNRHTDPKVTMRYLRSLGILIDSRLDDERRI